MISLGNFSAYSFYGAAWTVETLVERIRASGYTGAGLADMSGFHGAVEFSQACDRAGLRMILGCRLRIRDFVPGWLQVTVRDQTGYAATCRLLSENHAGETDWEALERLQAEASGHIWISCPIRVEHVYRTRIGDYPRWRSAWESLAEYGWDNLWLELGWQSAAGRLLQRRVFSEWSRLGWDRWVLVSGARHDGSPVGSELLELMQSMGTLTRIGQAHPDKLVRAEYGLLPAGEIRRRFAKVPQVLRQTQVFADACTFDFRFGRMHLPNPLIRTGADATEVSSGRTRQDRVLAWRCLRGIVQRYGSAYPWRDKPGRPELLERLRRELGVVSETGYAGYFLIFAEVVDECGRRGIPLLARGSAAGSLICYALGVANVCPFRFGLCFERFLNRERMRHSKLPDIDLDLPWDRREEIMTWLYERHGVEKVAMIGGFAHFKGRASVAEVAKAMGVPAHDAHAWSKRLPHGSLRKFLDDREGYVEAKGAWADQRFQEAVARAVDLHDLPRHPMMHPCGMVIADRPLTDFTPVGGSAKGFSMTQMSMDPIEDLGLLKMDLLGQAGLSVIRDCLENTGETIDIFERIDYADERIYEMIRDGEARGVFHIESPAMTSLLKLCRCADIDCLVATVSVIRPGAANEDKKSKFARRYLGMEEPVYAHPVLEEVLGDSYGLMIYEEHILLVANRFAGMDLGTADLLRRILIKKSDSKSMEELESVFRSSALHKGRSENEITTVWKELRDFSGFMFNKAHGAAYAVEAFQGCWLKLSYPVHFLSAVLNNQRGFYRPLVYVMEILRHKGRFRLPDVQDPGNAYCVVDEWVQIPLWQIKGLGERFLDKWTRERKKGPFADWEDFARRIQPEPADAGLLARTGALRGFFKNRHEAFWKAGQIRRQSHRGRAVPAGDDLFTVVPEVSTEALEEMSRRDRAIAEVELLGYPVSMDPFEFWMEDLERNGTIPICELENYVGREMEIAGIQVCHRLHRTLKGELMKFVSLADESGIAETVLFPDVYREFGWPLSHSHAARLRVNIERDETGSGLSLTVTEALTGPRE
ncbi:DNA polymerase III subunit alpha [Puniceicoccales bacterium CK1056]|uniref:DNA-directed DNA polymerase n=1 Tax=Oceanipulchritudo coccoides TaxID=2706888 RepID=A0A6B2LY16_9BACT|nr:DNA polymerase III subunit alpha [Oceanipulchritudo coccoides]NDV61223.1 DNA polymerase III subunit alpha [Oceanipulchritudo coccoides]